MNNINLCVKSEGDIDSMNHITRIYSNGLHMSFGLDKYKSSIYVYDHTAGFELPEGN